MLTYCTILHHILCDIITSPTPPHSKAKALGKKLQHRCWDAMVAQQYIKTPLFVAQNQFDNNQIPDELLCPPPICSEHPTSKVGKAFM